MLCSALLPALLRQVTHHALLCYLLPALLLQVNPPCSALLCYLLCYGRLPTMLCSAVAGYTPCYLLCLGRLSPPCFILPPALLRQTTYTALLHYLLCWDRLPTLLCSTLLYSPYSTLLQHTTDTPTAGYTLSIYIGMLSPCNSLYSSHQHPI